MFGKLQKFFEWTLPAALQTRFAPTHRHPLVAKILSVAGKAALAKATRSCNGWCEV
jgi:hypothetical protein